MKNRFFYVLFSCFFLLSTAFTAQAHYFDLQGGEELVIENVKTGNPICTFLIPEKYVNKDGSLNIPLEIILTQDNKTPVYTTLSTDFQVRLPAHLIGSYFLTIKIGGFTSVQKVTL